ncbi:unnamed protein product [Chrysoparadoxa australica]
MRLGVIRKGNERLRLKSGMASLAMAFDIDGVLLRGKDILPGAKQALQGLEAKRIPYVFVTNGGGCTESAKASELSEKLGVQVTKDMVCLSHSPMRCLAKEFGHKRILVLGSNATKIAQEDLGLSNTATVTDLANEWPDIFHFTGSSYYVERHFGGEKTKPVEEVEAIMVLHDPLDWALEIQVVVDVLRGGLPPGSSQELGHVPYFMSNADLLFASRYPEPRFGAGAFTEAVQLLYKRRFGEDCKPVVFGKPALTTFSYAEKLLLGRCEKLGLSPKLDRVCMVGDNPSGDIKGANEAGGHWESHLVCTGVFSRDSSHDNDPTNPADKVHDNVGDCVEWALATAASKS